MKPLIATFLLMLFIATIYSTSAQSWPGSEVSALYLYDAEFPPSSIACSLGLPTACFENDGGYNLLVQGAFAGYVAQVTPLVSGNIVNWQISGQSQCIASTEFCDSFTGELFEVMCGSNMGVSNPNAFMSVFTNYIWLGTEPVALARVNCSLYAANNPLLGLQGICQNGACV